MDLHAHMRDTYAAAGTHLPRRTIYLFDAKAYEASVDATKEKLTLEPSKRRNKLFAILGRAGRAIATGTPAEDTADVEAIRTAADIKLAIESCESQADAARLLAQIAEYPSTGNHATEALYGTAETEMARGFVDAYLDNPAGAYRTPAEIAKLLAMKAAWRLENIRAGDEQVLFQMRAIMAAANLVGLRALRQGPDKMQADIKGQSGLVGAIRDVFEQRLEMPRVRTIRETMRNLFTNPKRLFTSMGFAAAGFSGVMQSAAASADSVDIDVNFGVATAAAADVDAAAARAMASDTHHRAVDTAPHAHEQAKNTVAHALLHAADELRKEITTTKQALLDAEHELAQLEAQHASNTPLLSTDTGYTAKEAMNTRNPDGTPAAGLQKGDVVYFQPGVRTGAELGVVFAQLGPERQWATTTDGRIVALSYENPQDGYNFWEQRGPDGMSEPGNKAKFDRHIRAQELHTQIADLDQKIEELHKGMQKIDADTENVGAIETVGTAYEKDAARVLAQYEHLVQGTSLTLRDIDERVRQWKKYAAKYKSGKPISDSDVNLLTPDGNNGYLQEMYARYVSPQALVGDAERAIAHIAPLLAQPEGTLSKTTHMQLQSMHNALRQHITLQHALRDIVDNNIVKNGLGTIGELALGAAGLNSAAASIANPMHHWAHQAESIFGVDTRLSDTELIAVIQDLTTGDTAHITHLSQQPLRLRDGTINENVRWAQHLADVLHSVEAGEVTSRAIDAIEQAARGYVDDSAVNKNGNILVHAVERNKPALILQAYTNAITAAQQLLYAGQIDSAEFAQYLAGWLQVFPANVSGSEASPRALAMSIVDNEETALYLQGAELPTGAIMSMLTGITDPEQSQLYAELSSRTDLAGKVYTTLHIDDRHHVGTMEYVVTEKTDTQAVLVGADGSQIQVKNPAHIAPKKLGAAEQIVADALEPLIVFLNENTAGYSLSVGTEHSDGTMRSTLGGQVELDAPGKPTLRFGLSEGRAPTLGVRTAWDIGAGIAGYDTLTASMSWGNSGLGAGIGIEGKTTEVTDYLSIQHGWGIWLNGLKSSGVSINIPGLGSGMSVLSGIVSGEGIKVLETGQKIAGLPVTIQAGADIIIGARTKSEDENITNGLRYIEALAPHTDIVHALSIDTPTGKQVALQRSTPFASGEFDITPRVASGQVLGSPVAGYGLDATWAGGQTWFKLSFDKAAAHRSAMASMGIEIGDGVEMVLSAAQMKILLEHSGENISFRDKLNTAAFGAGIKFGDSTIGVKVYDLQGATHSDVRDNVLHEAAVHDARRVTAFVEHAFALGDGSVLMVHGETGMTRYDGRLDTPADIEPYVGGSVELRQQITEHLDMLVAGEVDTDGWHATSGLEYSLGAGATASLTGGYGSMGNSTGWTLEASVSGGRRAAGAGVPLVSFTPPPDTEASTAPELMQPGDHLFGSATDLARVLADMIKISERSTELNTAPTVEVNTGLTLGEGATGTITSSELSIQDREQIASEITITLTTAPTNGTLLLNGNSIAQGATFTQADINNNALRYQHDGGETTSDSFNFTAEDTGEETVSSTFNINVTPTNDTPTFGSTNATVAEGGNVDLATANLNGSDADNTPDELTYELTSVTNGTVLVNNVAIAVGDTFTQEQVNNGLVRFTHDGSETTSAAMNVTLSDPGNASTNGTVNIDVTGVNDAPEVSTITNQTLAGGNTLNLNYTASDAETTNADNLIYTATSSDTDLIPNANITLGGSGNNRTLQIEHDNFRTGTTTITLNVSDGDDTTTQTFEVTVTGKEITALAVGDISDTNSGAGDPSISPATPGETITAQGNVNVVFDNTSADNDVNYAATGDDGFGFITNLDISNFTITHNEADNTFSCTANNAAAVPAGVNILTISANGVTVCNANVI